MPKKKNVFTKIGQYLKSFTVGNSNFNYAVIYGLFGISMIMLKQLFTFLMRDENHIANPQNYIYIGVIGITLMVCLIVILVKKLGPENKFANYFIKIYPYLFIMLGMFIVDLYSTYNEKVMSFIVFMIVLFWIQIYKLFKRIAIFGIAALSYIVLSYHTYGPGETFTQDITLALMVALIILLAATILYQSHSSHQKVIRDLDIKNKNFKVAIDKLNLTHSSLKISKSITDSMYELTQEVLKNEKLEDVLQLVLEKAAALIPNSQAGSILILDGDELKFVAASGYDLKKLQKIRLKEEETFQSTLEDKYEPFIVKNLVVFDEGIMGKEKSEMLLDEGAPIAKTCITCSFKYQGEFFGSINIDNFDSEDVFLEKDKYLIKQLTQEIEIIISIHKLYEQALRPTKYDELTQAKTRRYCMHLLNKLISDDKGSQISICTIDINELKTINDRFGHDVGDKYLFEFSEIVRNADIADNIFGRVGGDEFLIIFDKMNRKETLEQINIIRNYSKKHSFFADKQKIEISFASGIAVYGVDGNDINELIKLSDKRMYEDKFVQKQIAKD
jgi:diguanylate cyclase (GGDEF)-like protein